jgi:hypothetical protein
VERSIFHGDAINILLGLLQILKRHKNVCVYSYYSIPHSETRKNYAKEQEEFASIYRGADRLLATAIDVYGVISVIWDARTNTLVFPDSFMAHVAECSKPFFVVPLYILARPAAGLRAHLNVIIINKVQHTFEIFEPNGSILPTLYQVNLQTNQMTDAIYKAFIGYGYNLVFPTCPVGLQDVQHQEALANNLIRPGDPEGYCAAWSLFYIDLRLKHPDAPYNVLVLNAVESFKRNQTPMTSFIRNYAEYITRERPLIELKIRVNFADTYGRPIHQDELNARMRVYIMKSLAEASK